MTVTSGGYLHLSNSRSQDAVQSAEDECPLRSPSIDSPAQQERQADCRRLNPEPGESIQHQSNICGAKALHMPSGAVHQLLHQLRRLQLCNWS